MRINIPNIADLMVATADIDGNIGIVDWLHYFYPSSQISFKFACADCCDAGNKITWKQDKIDTVAFNLGDKLAQDRLIYSIDAAAAVAGDDEFPGPLGKTCRGKCHPKKESKNKLQ